MSRIEILMDGYDKKNGKPGIEVLADMAPEKFILSETLTKEQTEAITRYAILHTVQRISQKGSPEEAEASYIKQEAEVQIKKAFSHDFNLAVAGVKTAMETSRQFLDSLDNYNKLVDTLKQRSS